MMNHDDPFSPETIEEQIDQHTFSPSHQPSSPNAHLIQELQAYYEEDRRSVARMWERLVQQVDELDAQQPLRRRHDKGIHHMEQPSHSSIPEHPRERSGFQRRLSLLVAIIIAVLLVGSLTTVLGLSRQKISTHTAHTASPTSTAIGQIVYNGPQGDTWLNTPVWSADSQLLAASDTSQTKIWDATTGQHSITIPLVGTLAWSPTSNLLAIGSSSGMTLVDGKTGQIVRTCTFPNASVKVAVTPSTGTTPLASHLPLSTGWGFGGFAWSPDGKQLVSAYSYPPAAGQNAPEGEVQVWNTQTCNLDYALATEPGYKMEGISWSPDGRYIAANMGKWNSQNSQVNVWNVQTHQVVFQQSVDSNQGFVGSSWQPGTDNFATALIVQGSDSSGSGTPTAAGTPTPTPVPNSLLLKIWNVKTGQLLKSYPGTYPGINDLSWSPNGQQVAYSVEHFTTTASMIIMDINSGQQLYTYQVSNSTPGEVSLTGTWSPNGKYIASVEDLNLIPSGNTGPSLGNLAYIVKVWTA